MDRSRKLAGFTLIELLISITILSLLVGLASYAFSLFTRHWSPQRDSVEGSIKQLQRLDLVTAALQDSLPWIVRGPNGKPGFYFLGRDEGLTIVTSSPVFSPGVPAVIRVFRESDGPERWKLVYEEAPLKGLVLMSADQVLPFQHRMVVVGGLRTLEFRYFGWRSLEERLKAGDGDLPAGFLGRPAWYSEFDGLTRSVQPQRLAIRLDGGEVVFDVPDRGDTLLNRSTEAL
jgi:prepilin-type N-terminal cleavage/methylation domain-containing protein